MAQLKDYPLKRRTDCRSAIAEALSDFLRRQTFTLPQVTRPFRFAAVYDTWASFEDRAKSAGGKLPAAAVLPDFPVYQAASFGPRMIDDTWSGGDPEALRPDGKPLYPLGDGSGDGFALFEVAQIEVPLVLVVRAKNHEQRKAIVAVLETLLVEDGSIVPDPSSLNDKVPLAEEPLQPVRYGLILSLSRYFDRRARYTLQSQQLLDSESTSQENRWLAQLEILAHAQVCTLRRVRAMKTRVEVVVDGEPVSRA